MSQLGVLLQESAEREPGATTALTTLRLLREEMDGVDLGNRRKRSLKERIGLNKMGCCGGPIWGFFSPTTMPVQEVEQEVFEGAAAGQEIHHQESGQEEEEPPASDHQPNGITTSVCGSEDESPAGMNLAAALSAERQYRASQEAEGETVTGRVSLMKLLEEAEGGEEAGKLRGGGEWMCCVCMGRKKGAAFIPCGHTYCRVCSRELWLNRGTCPLCNRAILEILDIF